MWHPDRNSGGGAGGADAGPPEDGPPSPLPLCFLLTLRFEAEFDSF
jgi:hypothetical protein